jgi:hypothetical protein
MTLESHQLERVAEAIREVAGQVGKSNDYLAMAHAAIEAMPCQGDAHPHMSELVRLREEAANAERVAGEIIERLKAMPGSEEQRVAYQAAWDRAFRLGGEAARDRLDGAIGVLVRFINTFGSRLPESWRDDLVDAFGIGAETNSMRGKQT